jgi:uncharacterized protein YndB with AHSA1/START domain
MTRTPTGRIDREGEQWVLTLQRAFRAPIEDVWASVTESDRLARWIGTWTGDPASGRVAFTMTAEGATEPEEMEIRECVPPRLLKVTSGMGWHLDLHLAEDDGVTTLTFAQPGIDPVEAESVGPGWEYYLDRLVAAESGGDIAAIDFEREYYPAMLEHYQQQLG